ncbi:hypothetical protein IGB42_01955 [Andreprevotia sp. IGB-42]|uniref:SOS response-associated peptidase n=1 Tax=Andreprevotia sp. IGB-42 TaxID=2497473 RepID=UPI00135A3540|nr:SOS response-associated peptidase family protein [Andreprevotia sp. IGB-42]KAF0813604.1 hypothetical protein IGB42_01955 [Andreprevotia sp. IGB-42]
MCVNYRSLPAPTLQKYFLLNPPAGDWPTEVWQDYQAPIIIQGDDGNPQALLASYGMVPRSRIPANMKKFSTMNARAETLAQRRSYRTAWQKGYRCLVPMQVFYEPCYESGRAERYQIGMADGSPFAVAGIWRPWKEAHGGYSFSFSQITVNADAHPVMQRMHKPGDEKRSLVMVPEAGYAQWLTAENSDIARQLLVLPDGASLMAAALPMPIDGSGPVNAELAF